VIPSDWRRKGGALLLGAQHGEPGPFGTFAEDDDHEHGVHKGEDGVPYC
jgi:hypothetical protein